jgi:hypothetical protein
MHNASSTERPRTVVRAIRYAAASPIITFKTTAASDSDSEFRIALKLSGALKAR